MDSSGDSDSENVLCSFQGRASAGFRMEGYEKVTV